MKHLKTLAIAVAAAGVLMAMFGAGTSSAAVICSTTADPCPSAQKWPVGTIIDFSLASGTSSDFQETAEDGGETLDTCKSSTVKGKLTNAGGAGVTATGEITEWTWGTCTFPTTTTLKGKFEVKKIAGTSNGTVLSDGETRWTSNTIFFGSCIYTVEAGKSMGDLTEGKPAVFHINTVAHKTTGSELVCPTTQVWTAAFTLTSPSNTTASISNE